MTEITPCAIANASQGRPGIDNGHEDWISPLPGFCVTLKIVVLLLLFYSGYQLLKVRGFHKNPVF